MRSRTLLVTMLLIVSVATLEAGTKKTTWKCRPDGESNYFVITQIDGSERLYLSYMTARDVPVWTVPVTMTESGNVETFSGTLWCAGGWQKW